MPDFAKLLVPLRNALNWDDEKTVSGIVQAIIGSILGYLVAKSLKYMLIFVGLVTIGLELLRRNAVLGFNYDNLFSRTGEKVNAAFDWLNDAQKNTAHRNFAAGILVGLCSCLK